MLNDVEHCVPTPRRCYHPALLAGCGAAPLRPRHRGVQGCQGAPSRLPRPSVAPQAVAHATSAAARVSTTNKWPAPAARGAPSFRFRSLASRSCRVGPPPRWCRAPLAGAAEPTSAAEPTTRLGNDACCADSRNDSLPLLRFSAKSDKVGQQIWQCRTSSAKGHRNRAKGDRISNG